LKNKEVQFKKILQSAEDENILKKKLCNKTDNNDKNMNINETVDKKCFQDKQTATKNDAKKIEKKRSNSYPSLDNFFWKKEIMARGLI
jgi:hypothetical protein